MESERIEYLASQIVKLSPFEKGKLFSLFLIKERHEMKGKRTDLRDSIKMDREITDEDIESCLYNPDIDDIVK